MQKGIDKPIMGGKIVQKIKRGVDGGEISNIDSCEGTMGRKRSWTLDVTGI